MRCILSKNISTWFSLLLCEGQFFAVIYWSAVYTTVLPLSNTHVEQAPHSKLWLFKWTAYLSSEWSMFGLAEYRNSNCMSKPKLEIAEKRNLELIYIWKFESKQSRKKNRMRTHLRQAHFGYWIFYTLSEIIVPSKVENRINHETKYSWNSRRFLNKIYKKYRLYYVLL